MHPASQALKQAGVSEVVLAINYQPEVRASAGAACLPEGRAFASNLPTLQ